MSPKDFSHIKAVLLSLFVTVLWSSSWVLVKVGLQDIPPLTFAGLRYVWAFLVLLPVTLLSQERRNEIRGMLRRDWLRLALLGLIFYTATQGLVYVALAYLQATTLSLLLNFTTVVVAIIGIFWLAEMPTFIQWVGVFIYLVGVIIYFYPLGTDEPVIGLIVGGVVVVVNAASALLGREINRSRILTPMTITLVSMGVGGVTLLVLGVLLQGLPHIDLLGWGIIGWLAIVNSAFAFTLWNITQRTLTATESSIINNTMLIQIALFAWVFLDEHLTLWEIGGLALAALGILFVQMRVSVRNSISKVLRKVV